MEVTKIIAKFVVESSYADIPGKVRHEATRTVLNWVGCAIGGCRHETKTTVRQVVYEMLAEFSDTLERLNEAVDR